jgi:hypothetical protein
MFVPTVTESVFELFAANAHIYKQISTRLNPAIKSFTMNVHGLESVTQKVGAFAFVLLGHCWCLHLPIRLFVCHLVPPSAEKRADVLISQGYWL